MPQTVFWRSCTRATRGPLLIRAKRSFTANTGSGVIKLGASPAFSAADHDPLEIPVGSLGLLQASGLIEFLNQSPQLRDFSKQIERGEESHDVLFTPKELRFRLVKFGVTHLHFEYGSLEWLG